MSTEQRMVELLEKQTRRIAALEATVAELTAPEPEPEPEPEPRAYNEMSIDEKVAYTAEKYG